MVEDDAELRTAMRRYLTVEGFGVQEAEDGTQALRQAGCWAPVLMATAYGDVEDRGTVEAANRAGGGPVSS